MAKAVIEINGVIGGDVSRADDIGTTLQDVKRQFNLVNNPDGITVFINSDGGRVTEGFAIHDFLRAQGLPVETIGSTVFSIATVILMAGDQGKRQMRPNGRFLVHNPMPSFGIQSDAEGYRQLANLLESEQNELISFYARKTPIPADSIKNLMREDKPITAQRAVELGFVDGIKETDNKTQDNTMQPLQAKYIPSGEFQALRESLINKYNTHNMDNEKKTVLQNLGKGLKALLNMADDTPEIEVETKPETPDFEKRFTEMEARITQMEADKNAAIEEKTAFEAKANELTKLVNQKASELENKDTEIKAVIKRIEEMENQPAVTNQTITAPIVNSAEPKGWVPQELINQFVYKLKN